MADYIAEQFEDLYSEWSLLDKVGKDARLAEMIVSALGLYQYLIMHHGRKCYLKQDEFNHVEQIRQIDQYL